MYCMTVVLHDSDIPQLIQNDHFINVDMSFDSLHLVIYTLVNKCVGTLYPIVWEMRKLLFFNCTTTFSEWHKLICCSPYEEDPACSISYFKDLSVI